MDAMGPSGRVEKRLIRTSTGHEILFDDGPDAPRVVISQKDGSSVTLDANSGDVTIAAKRDLHLTAGGKVTIHASQTVAINAGQDVTIDATLSLSGAAQNKVSLTNHNATLVMNGRTVDVNEGGLQVI
jgi:uncharacterized protein (DUF2345 family)